MRFEWDPKKESINRGKHAVSFAEASTTFDDPNGSIFDDPKHSIAEHREIIVGTSFLGRVLLTSFTERNDSIRIISARLANKKERMDYEEYQKNSH